MQSALVSLLAVANAATAQAAYSFDPLQHLAGIAPYFEDPRLDRSRLSRTIGATDQ